MAAEPNTAHDLMILQGDLLAAEPNTVHDLMILHGGLLAAELKSRKTRIG